MIFKQRRRLVLVLVGSALLAAVLIMVRAPVASAAPFDLCKDAPSPVSPQDGMTGMLTIKPKDIPVDAPDPFKDPTIAIGQVYGYNWQWANYDLGCGNDFLRDPLAVSNTKSANVAMGLAGAVVAGLDAAEELAKEAGIGWLRDVIGTVASSLQTVLLGGAGKVGWLAIAVAAAGVLLVWRARSTSYQGLIRLVAAVLVACAVSVATLLFPQATSRAIDRAVQEVAKIAGGSFAASVSDAVNREGAYQAWLAGYFGSAESELAKEYGPRLLSATHYTWSDVARMERDPSARKQIDAAKAREFTAIAKEVEDRSPSAYETFTGRGERTGVAVLGLITVGCMALFGYVAFVMILVGRVMMQGLVIAAPIAAPIGAVSHKHVALLKLWGLFSAGIVAVAKFSIAAGVMALVLGGITGSETLSQGESVFWVIVATVIGLVLTRPARTFKTMMPGMDPDHSYLRDGVSKLLTVAAVSKGVQLADAASDSDTGEAPEQDTSGPTRTRVRQLSGDAIGTQPPLPAPEWAARAGEPPALDEGEGWVGAIGAEDRKTLGGTVRPALEGSGEPVRVEGELGLGTLVIEAGLDLHHTVTDEGGTRTEVISSAESVSAEGGPVEVAATVRAGQGSPAVEGDPPVVYPTGVIVQRDPSLYHSDGSGTPDEEYIRLPEAEADAFGREHAHVGYRSGRDGSHGG